MAGSEDEGDVARADDARGDRDGRSRWWSGRGSWRCRWRPVRLAIVAECGRRPARRRRTPRAPRRRAPSRRPRPTSSARAGRCATGRPPRRSPRRRRPARLGSRCPAAPARPPPPRRSRWWSRPRGRWGSSSPRCRRGPRRPRPVDPLLVSWTPTYIRTAPATSAASSAKWRRTASTAPTPTRSAATVANAPRSVTTFATSTAMPHLEVVGDVEQPRSAGVVSRSPLDRITV